jgi:hypothetical protein
MYVYKLPLFSGGGWVAGLAASQDERARMRSVGRRGGSDTSSIRIY